MCQKMIIMFSLHFRVIPKEDFKWESCVEFIEKCGYKFDYLIEGNLVMLFHYAKLKFRFTFQYSFINFP